MLLKFKALRSFACGDKMFIKNDKEHEADAEQVKGWANADYVKIIEPYEAKESNKEVEGTNTTPKVENADNGENEGAADEFEGMDYNKLKAAAKAANIKGYNTMKKEDLIAALRGE